MGTYDSGDRDRLRSPDTVGQLSPETGLDWPNENHRRAGLRAEIKANQQGWYRKPPTPRITTLMPGAAANASAFRSTSFLRKLYRIFDFPASMAWRRSVAAGVANCSRPRISTCSFCYRKHRPHLTRKNSDAWSAVTGYRSGNRPPRPHRSGMPRTKQQMTSPSCARRGPTADRQ